MLLAFRSKYAEQYLPYGCGEYCLDHISFGSPNCSLNLLKALEAVLHHGRDVLTGEKIGLDPAAVSLRGRAQFARRSNLPR